MRYIVGFGPLGWRIIENTAKNRLQAGFGCFRRGGGGDCWTIGGVDQHKSASLRSYGHTTISRSFIGAFADGLATNYVHYCSRRTTTSDFLFSERYNRVQFSPIGGDSLRTFLTLPDDIPKGWRERLGGGLDCGLAVNYRFSWSRRSMTTPIIESWAGCEGLNLACWGETLTPIGSVS